MKQVKLIAVGILLMLLMSCASKSQNTRLLGIQKQIAYLTNSYSNLSLKLGEIQDSLLVLQYKVESQDSSVSPQKNAGKKTNRKFEKEDPEKTSEITKPSTESTAIEKDEIPVFELGEISNSTLKGQEGKVYKLDGDSGYIKVEGKASSEKPQTTKAETSNQGPVASPQEFYKSGFSLYSNKKFNKAIETFSEFLRVFPEHDLSDNAVYWIGESYVGKGEYALALPEFQRVPLDYPNGNKVADALLMIGICFDKMKNTINARDSWQKLVSLFPNTMAAKIAKKKLEGEKERK